MHNRKIIILFLNQNNVVGTQKNRLNETVLLSTQNIYVRKYAQFYAENFCLSKPLVYFILLSLIKLAKINALDPLLPRAKCKTNYVIN